ncbi:MAG: hypothetical protein CVV49_00060 [Spirochaetae bacterium HGW-Spirochaetae-5]|nr:MAG: hypothetical protein CVV49_00060 [Spirochaetae bacterium HGW-Spirochaetae-5]
MKIVHDNRGHLILFKKAIFWTEACKEESNYYDWKSSLRAHNNINGKYDIHLNLNLNKDVPDISELPAGKYRIVISFYNPSKRTKNRLYGCVDTQSIDFVVGSPLELKNGGERGTSNHFNPSPISQLNQLEEIGNVVNKVGEILNKSLDIHKNTIMFQNEIEKTAFEKGYQERLKQEESERTIKTLTERLDALERGKELTTGGNNSLVETLLKAGKSMGILPDIDINNITPEQIVSILSKFQAPATPPAGE